MIVARLESAIRFFLYILVFWVPYSPAVIESCVVTALVLWICKTIAVYFQKMEKKRFINSIVPQTGITKEIGFFLVICLLSTLASAMTAIALKGLLTKTMEWFIVFFLMVDSIKTRRQALIFLNIFMLTSAAVILNALYQYHISYKDLFSGRMIEAGGRAIGSFKSPNSLGGYLTIVLPMAVSLFFTKYANKFLPFLALFIILGFWALFVTFSEGAWLGVLCGTAVIILYRIKLSLKKQWRKDSVRISAVILIFLFIYAIGTSLYHLNNSEGNSAMWRLNIWHQTMDMVKDRPLFGHGLNTYMGLFQYYRPDAAGSPTYSHNCYLQMTTEIGLLGLSSFLWMLFVFFRGSFIRIKEQWKDKQADSAIIVLGLVGGAMAFLTHSFFDVNLYSLQLVNYFWLMMGFAACTQKIKI